MINEQTKNKNIILVLIFFSKGYNDQQMTCSRHTETVETCQDCMRNIRLIINKLCIEGNELTE